MIKLLPILFLFQVVLANAQMIAADSIVHLQTPMEESSGLVVLNNRIITFGDSGNPPALYEIDTLSGTASRTVFVGNATNVDWEDICKDNTHIYIGDFGNNQGTRQDLKIYKITIADYLNTTTDTVFADTISFSYADQSSFNPAPFQTNYDAEGLISFGDSLYVFTKQWSKPGTTIYSLPKTPGSYSSHKIDSITTINFVTAADFNPVSGFLALVSHTNNYATLLIDYGWYPSKADGPTRTGYFLQVKQSLQVEGLAIKNFRNMYFSSETGLLGDGILSRIRTPIIGLEEYPKSSISLYPNPSSGIIHLECKETIAHVSVVDVLGMEIMRISEPPFGTVRINHSGHYLFRIHLKNGEVITHRVSVVK